MPAGIVPRATDALFQVVVVGIAMVALGRRSEAKAALDTALDGAFVALGLSETQRRLAVEGRGRDLSAAPIAAQPAAVSEAPRRPATRRSTKPAPKPGTRPAGSRLVELREVIPFSPLPIKRSSGTRKGGR